MDLSVNTVAKKQIVLIICIAIIIMGFGGIFYRSLGAFPFALGVIITSSFAVVKVKWLEANINLMEFIEGEVAQLNYIRIHGLLRLLATGAVLVGVVYFDRYILSGTLLGAGLGLLTEPFSKYGCYFLLKKDGSNTEPDNKSKTEDGDE